MDPKHKYMCINICIYYTCGNEEHKGILGVLVQDSVGTSLRDTHQGLPYIGAPI